MKWGILLKWLVGVGFRDLLDRIPKTPCQGRISLISARSHSSTRHYLRSTTAYTHIVWWIFHNEKKRKTLSTCLNLRWILFLAPTNSRQPENQIAWSGVCVFFLLPATGIVEDHQSIREAVQVVVPKVQGQGLAGFSFNKAPNCLPVPEIWQHWYPLQ